MQSLCAVSRISTKVTISQNKAAEVFVDNEFRYGDILPTSFRPESPILSDNLKILYCLLNDWNHSRLQYCKSCGKYPNNASRPKYIGISKFSLMLWRISMLCDGVVHTILLLPASCHPEIFTRNAFTILNEPPLKITNKMTCKPSEDSDQPGHPPSLIRVFAVSINKRWGLSYPLSAQRRL